MPAGNLVFHGPREQVVPHFSSLGFQVPERKAVSDFLQEVTSKKDQQVALPLLVVHAYIDISACLHALHGCLAIAYSSNCLAYVFTLL